MTGRILAMKAGMPYETRDSEDSVSEVDVDN